MKMTGTGAVNKAAPSGIGEVAARLFVEEGAVVVRAAGRRESIDALVREFGDAVWMVATAVSDPVPLNALFAPARARFGGLDLAFNNAGLGTNSTF